VLIEDVPESLSDILWGWLYALAKNVLVEPHTMAVRIKNQFRLQEAIPRTRPNNSMAAPAEYSFTAFLMRVAYNDPKKFFTIVDYLFRALNTGAYPRKLEKI
jgi:hypothetical protein